MSLRDNVTASISTVFLELHCAEQKRFRACSMGGDGRESQVLLHIQWIVLRQAYGITRIICKKDSVKKLEGPLLQLPFLQKIVFESSEGDSWLGDPKEDFASRWSDALRDKLVGIRSADAEQTALSAARAGLEGVLSQTVRHEEGPISPFWYVPELSWWADRYRGYVRDSID